MSKINDDDSRVVAIKMFQSAMTAVEGIPDHLRHTFVNGGAKVGHWAAQK